jgi:hypothetical protein
MIKVLPGSKDLIEYLESIGGKNIHSYSGNSDYHYYYIEPCYGYIECIHKVYIKYGRFIICKNIKEYQRQTLINYQEI